MEKKSSSNHRRVCHGMPPAFAQRFTPETIAQQIYEQMPEIPKNNQYISSNTGEVMPQHTLISRFIRYHEYIKSRPVVFSPRLETNPR